MTILRNCVLRRMLAVAAFGMVSGGVVLGGLSQTADARVFVGFGFPFPFYFGPPVYYPPPAYYYPPPAYYPPPYYAPRTYYPPPPYAPSYAPSYAPPGYSYQATPSRQSCETGGTVCPMEHAVTPGSSCYCTTAQGRVWGRAT
jgi:hypothetical protein